MKREFTHLCIHTDYSFYESTCSARRLAVRLRKLGMDSCGCTDIGSMSGVFEFSRAMLDAGLKPIVGAEVRHRPDPAGPEKEESFSLNLLAENETGYRNLCHLMKLSTSGRINGTAAVDCAMLRECSQGVIAISGFLRGLIPSVLLSGDTQRAEACLKQYIEIFGRDNFFLGIMNHGRDEEKAVVPLIIGLAKKYRIGAVAVQDVRYLLKEDHEAYHVFRCIGAEEKNGESRPSRISAPEYYLKSADEMCSWASAFPESITNTFLIAERCSFTVETDPCRNRHYPVYIADDRSSGSSVTGCPNCRELLLSRCLANIGKRYGFIETEGNSSGREEVLNRLDHEIDRIDKTGYTGLFLILSDFTQWAREQGIPVGPGRGNSTASITAYLAGITEIDPVRHGLIFESFLNPEYGIFPEFSVDICDRRRSEVVAYFKDKFGSDRVARSLTTHRMKAKSMLFDIGRVLGFSPEEIGSIVSMIPDDPKINMAGIIELDGIKSLIGDNHSANERIRKLFVYSKSIEGLMRTPGIHSCGLIIGNGPLTDTVPVGHTDTGELCTQFTAEACRSLGLLQINILGWKLLTVIGDAVRLISRHRGIAIDIHSIPSDDPTTYRLIRKGDTSDLVFFETESVRDLCRKARVNSFDDLVAVLSLIPETSQEVKDSWIRRRTGEEPVTYNIPGTETVLLETCGLVLYREQIVQIIHLFSGLSFSRSVQLFRSLKEIGESVRSECGDMFHDGSIARGMSKNTIRALWKFLATSAGSVQDRSHMAACITVAYRAAYLKANFPVEYMDAVKSAENDNNV